MFRSVAPRSSQSPVASKVCLALLSRLQSALVIGSRPARARDAGKVAGSGDFIVVRRSSCESLGKGLFRGAVIARGDLLPGLRDQDSELRGSPPAGLGCSGAGGSRGTRHHHGKGDYHAKKIRRHLPSFFGDIGQHIRETWVFASSIGPDFDRNCIGGWSWVLLRIQ